MSRVLCWGSANQLGNICCPSGKVKEVTVPGLDVHSIPRSSPSWCKAQPPLGPIGPAGTITAPTIGSQKLALIYMEPWDGLRLSVHQSVSVSCLDRTQAALDLSYRLRRLNPDFWLVRRGVRRAPPAVWPADWSVNTGRWTCVPEFNFRIHFWETCVYRNDVESQDPSEGLRVDAK